MKTHSKIRLAVWLFALAGAALFTVLLARQGVGEVATAVAAAGWGIVAVAAFHLVPLFLDTLAWQVLFPRAERPRLRSLFWMRWIGESISALVPSAAVGGDIARARLAAIRGTPLPVSVASVLVDITLGIFTQIVFTLAGIALLVAVAGRSSSIVGPALIGTLIGILALAGFYFVQRKGMFRIIGLIVSKLAHADDWHSLVRNGTALDEAVRALYARRRGVVACCVWTILSLVLGSGEIWLALHALGVHATAVHALILESVVLTIRSAAFPVPGAIGVQEGGYIVIGSLLGIPGETALALSLIWRARELALGIPALIAWQVIEGRRLLREGVPPQNGGDGDSPAHG